MYIIYISPKNQHANYLKVIMVITNCNNCKFSFLPARSCSWQACPRLVSSVDLLRSFNWTMLVEMTWMVDTWVSARFEASSMAANLLTSSWFPSKMFFSFKISNWLSKRRNSSWKEGFFFAIFVLQIQNAKVLKSPNSRKQRESESSQRLYDFRFSKSKDNFLDFCIKQTRRY